jgi:hypothetical protein
MATRLELAVRHFYIEQIDAWSFGTCVRGFTLSLNCISSSSRLSCDFETAILNMLALVDPVMAEEAAAVLTALEHRGFGPNVAILGAQKCGTTSLYRYLGCVCVYCRSCCCVCIHGVSFTTI